MGSDPIFYVFVTLLAVILLDVGAASAQTTPAQSPPSESFGIGTLGGPGVPGAIAAVRVSLPATPRAGLDFDIGGVSRPPAPGRPSGRAYVAQLRWLRKPRRPDGAADFFLFGAMHMRATRTTVVRFPGETIERTERVNGLSPVFGYGWDWRSERGARVGAELASGGSPAAGPRVFLKVFALWGPPR